MINAQDYIDNMYGKNKERDSKPEHKYYLNIIQDLLIQQSNVKKMHNYEITFLKGGSNV